MPADVRFQNNNVGQSIICHGCLIPRINTNNLYHPISSLPPHLRIIASGHEARGNKVTNLEQYNRTSSFYILDALSLSVLKSVTGIGIGNGLSGEETLMITASQMAFINWLSQKSRGCIVFLYIKEMQIDWQQL